jgi:hypothetical protein
LVRAFEFQLINLQKYSQIEEIIPVKKTIRNHSGIMKLQTLHENLKLAFLNNTVEQDDELSAMDKFRRS